MRKTLLLGFFVALIAGYSIYEYRQSLVDQDMGDGSQLAFRMRGDDIVYMQLTRAGEVIELEKRDNHWFMTKPLSDAGDDPGVNGFVFALVNQRLRAASGGEASEKPEWSNFGLEPPGLRIELRDRKGKTQTLELANKNAYDGSFYARQDGKLWLADSGIAALKERPSFSFRSKRLWRETELKVDNVDVQAAGESFRFNRVEGAWVMVPKPEFAIDSEKVDDWLTRVTDFAPADVARDYRRGPEEVEANREFFLLKPSYTILVNAQNEKRESKQWTLTIGADRDQDVFLRSSDRATIYRTTSSALNSVRVPRVYFRDGRSAFRFNLELAATIDIHTPQFSDTFHREDGGWKAAGKNKGNSEFTPAKLILLMQNVQNLEAAEFPAGPLKGIKTSQIVVRDKAGKEIFNLAWGDEYKAQRSWNAGRTLRYVKTNLEKDTLGVPKEMIDMLFTTKDENAMPQGLPAGHP